MTGLLEIAVERGLGLAATLERINAELGRWLDHDACLHGLEVGPRMVVYVYQLRPWRHGRL